MASPIIADNYRTYMAHPQDTLLGEVIATFCVLLPRSFAAAGFGSDGRLLVIHNNSYPGDYDAWDRHFFEQQLMNEPLLGLPVQASAVFAGSSSQLLIPGSLYQQQQSAQWLKSIHHISPAESVVTYHAAKVDAHYLVAIPENIKTLVAQYMPVAPLLPVIAYQLGAVARPAGAFLQCLITGEEVYATLRLNNKITWHHVFPYIHVTDIVWEITAFCKQHQIPQVDLHILASITSDADYDDLLELETYFPKLSWRGQSSIADKAWEPAIYLMEQLYQCVL